jgi:hypothetical protein
VLDLEGVAPGFGEPQGCLVVSARLRKAAPLVVCDAEPVVGGGEQDVVPASLRVGDESGEPRATLFEFPNVGQELDCPRFGDGGLGRVAETLEEVSAVFKVRDGLEVVALYEVRAVVEQ